MKMYAAKGLLEWQMLLKVDNATLKICFSGGSMGPNGVIPAKYSTDSPVIQHLIENSEEYKEGRIVSYVEVSMASM